MKDGDEEGSNLSAGVGEPGCVSTGHQRIMIVVFNFLHF